MKSNKSDVLPVKKKMKLDDHQEEELLIRSNKSESDYNHEDDFNNDPVHPVEVPHVGDWRVTDDGNVLYRRIVSTSTPTPASSRSSSAALTGTSKVLGLDLSGTLYASIKQFPHALQDYEIYNKDIISKLQQAHRQGYTLVVFINQGGIRSAVQGKTASKIKTLIEFIAREISKQDNIDNHTASSTSNHRLLNQSESVPLYAFISTQKKSGFHKPSAEMWNIAQSILQTNFDAATSLYVGDGVDLEKHENGETISIHGDDEHFARNIEITFQTSMEYFGPSSISKRIEQRSLSSRLSYSPPPPAALDARRDLTCHLLSGPILLLLCGPQGSGKSYLCQQLVRDNVHWKSYSQDTIRNGKAGTRQAVEQATLHSLRDGHNVIVDRMHLDPSQRQYFISIAKTMAVAVHCITFTTSKEVVKDRVEKRTDHIVMGVEGAKLAVRSCGELVMPSYQEGFQLMSATGTTEGVQRFVTLYRRVVSGGETEEKQRGKRQLQSFNNTSARLEDDWSVPRFCGLGSNVHLPSIALGTYKMGKSVTRDIVKMAFEMGIHAVDTAPTYNNEDQVGDAFAQQNGIGSEDDSVAINTEHAFCIVKVPKRATSAEQVKQELVKSLEKLQRTQIDLLLLHWPCDVIAMDTLKEVWSAMEDCVREGKVRALGVCNFNIEALRLLLCHCQHTRPSVLQVERHVMLPQWDLADFCNQHDIVLQAHSPLGQGSLLDHAVVKTIARRLNVSSATVLLQWNLIQNVAVVTKCSTKEHMKDALAAIRDDAVLSNEDMKSLNGCNESGDERMVCPPFMFGDEAYCWGRYVTTHSK